MAIAVLHSNDHASDVVRVIAGVTRPSLRIYEWEKPLPTTIVTTLGTRVSLGRLAKPLNFRPLARMKLPTGGNHLVSAVPVGNHGTVSHMHARKTCLNERAILRASATRSMHLEGIQVMWLDYIWSEGLWHGAWKA